MREECESPVERRLLDRVPERARDELDPETDRVVGHLASERSRAAILLATKNKGTGLRRGGRNASRPGPAFLAGCAGAEPLSDALRAHLAAPDLFWCDPGANPGSSDISRNPA
jgi:hypothetical protein